MFKESQTLTQGESLTHFSTKWGEVGLGICYDIRFPEMARLYSVQFGCKLLIYPAAFNTTTGPLHWSLLVRARALDCQCYVLAVSPARNESGYRAYGHTMLADPMGQVVQELGHETDTLVAEIGMFASSLSSFSFFASKITGNVSLKMGIVYVFVHLCMQVKGAY